MVRPSFASIGGHTTSGRRQTLIAALLVVCGIGARDVAHGEDNGAGDAPAFRVIAYHFGDVKPDQIGAEKLTHINYAFAHVSNAGQVVLDDPRAPARLAKLTALKQRNPHLKIILSIGGWGADNFSDAALTDDSRGRFADSAVDMIKQHALDGMDLDWEYPGQPGPGIKFRPKDKQNFTLLLQAARERFDAYDRGRPEGAQQSLLTIASAGGEYFAHTEMDKLHEYLNWINVMTYDFYGSFSPTTGHHTGLFRSAHAPESSPCAAAVIEQHLAAGIPSRKLVIGAAFYGRAWSGVKPDGQGINQPFEKYDDSHSYAKLLDDFVDKNGFVRRWDADAKAPYLWNSDSRTFVSYDDPESLEAKAEFVRTHKLGGMMYWQHSHDPAEHLLTVIAEQLR